MAATVLFYHLTRRGLEETLRMILGRAVDQGWRVMLRAPDKDLLARLDDRLWLEPEDGFLAHGLEGAGDEARQPVLLGQGAIANAAQGLMLLAGAGVTQAEAGSLERIWIIFDGADETAVDAARGQWREVTGWGLAAQYWSDEGGAWAKKLERAAESVSQA